MEELNRIELQGWVGSSSVIAVGGGRVAHVSLRTDHVLTDASGTASVETTWHNVTVWDGRMSGSLDDIRVGCALHVTGRLRRHTYVGLDGVERYSTEVVAGWAELVGRGVRPI